MCHYREVYLPPNITTSVESSDWAGRVLCFAVTPYRVCFIPTSEAPRSCLVYSSLASHRKQHGAWPMNPRGLLHSAACDVSLQAIDSYLYDDRIRVSFFLYSVYLQMYTDPMAASASTQSGSPKATVNATGCAAYHIPYLHPAPIACHHSRDASCTGTGTGTMRSMHASAWLTFRRLTAEPSLANSQSDCRIQHHHRLCLRWAEHHWIVIER